MKFKFIYLIFIIILNFNFIKSLTYTYYINGTGNDLSSSCSEDNQCFSVEKVIYIYLEIINYSYYGSGTYPPLEIYIGPDSSFFSNENFKPFNPTQSSSSSDSIGSIDLYRFNVSFIGTNNEDGSQVSIKSNSTVPVFTIEPDYWAIPTSINFVNLNYGGGENCNSNTSNYSNLPDNGELIQLSAIYNFQLSINFMNFNYSCQSNDKTFILISGQVNQDIATSQDWDQYIYYYPTTSYSVSFINSVFSNSFSNKLNCPLFNSTYSPIKLSLIESTFDNNLQVNSSSPFIIGRGQLIVQESTFQDNNSTSFDCLETIFKVNSVEVYFNNNQVSLWPVHKNKLIDCDGCSFTGVGNNITTSFYSTNKECSTNNPSLLSFSRSTVTIMNSNLTMTNLNGYSTTIQQDANIIYASLKSQISLRSNLISSSIGSVLNYNNVNSFMFSNIFSNSYEPLINCNSQSSNTFNGDKFSMNIGTKYGYNCNKYNDKIKLNAALIFGAIGVAIAFGSLIFLYVARYAIRRCSGPLNQ